MTYSIETYSMGDKGFVVLRDDIKTIKTARILACRYAKRYSKVAIYPTRKSNLQKYAQDVFREGAFAKEEIYYSSQRSCYVSEKEVEVLDGKKGYSPIVHKYYKVNGRTGDVTLIEEYRKKW